MARKIKKGVIRIIMSKQKEYLWDILKVNKDFKCSDIDSAYNKIENKTSEVTLAWKILRDEYYSEVYKKYLDIDIVVKAGFIIDKLQDIDYYNLNLLTTPVSKLIDKEKAKKCCSIVNRRI